MVRFESIAQVIKERLSSGYYRNHKFPSERDLAIEFEASYLTARKSVKYLIELGLLARTSRGRAEPVMQDERQRVTLLCHDWPSQWILRLRQALSLVADDANLIFNTRHYLHWEDEIIAETLRSSQGVVFIPSSADPPPRLVTCLQESSARVLVTRSDFISQGLHLLDRLPSVAVSVALDHLVSLGHRWIAIYNVQPDDAIIRLRLEQAKIWSRKNPEITLVFSGRPIESGDHSLPAARAQGHILLKRPFPSAALALTIAAAQGLARAAIDFGLEIGVDFSIAAIDGERLAEDLIPSITSVDADENDLHRILVEATAWMKGGDWTDSLLHACKFRLHVRESSGRAR